MTNHPESWFIHQLAWCRYCMALADKVHTPEEIHAAWDAINAHIAAVRTLRQGRLALDREPLQA